MKASRVARKARGEIAYYLLLGVVLAALLFPFYWGLITSLKYEVDIYDFSGNFLIPKHPNLNNYITLFSTPNFFVWFRNTLVVSTIATIISVVISVMAGFAIARLRFRGAGLAGTMVFITYLAPKTLMFVPLAQILKDWGLLGGLPALMLTYPTILIPFSTWLLMGYFKTIPFELEECALIDGATRWQILTKIVLPLAIPGLISAFIFCFTLCWNEFIYALTFLSSTQNKTVPVAIVNEFVDGDIYRWGSLMAGALVGSLPLVILYAFFVEHYVSAMTGAVKE